MERMNLGNESVFSRMTRKDLAWYWLLLAVGSLTVSGLFAFFIAIARAPGLSALFTDPMFFRRALVVHVDLGVSVWFTAFPVVLFHLLNRARAIESSARGAFSVSLAGVLLMVLTGFSNRGEPYLSNYIPVISHPLFLFGLALYFGSVGFNYLSHGLLDPPREGLPAGFGPAQIGIRIGALYLLVTIATIITAYFCGPAPFPSASYYEMLMWGGGHVLQFSNVCFMLVCLIILLASWLGESPVTRKQSFLVFSWLMLPLFLVPWFAAQNTWTPAHRQGFTWIMRWGLFPPVLFFILLTLPHVIRKLKETRDAWSDVRLIGSVLSVLLICSGFVFGSLVRGSDLRLPGHYHASIGAVTLAFMTATYVLLQEFGFNRYGSGQAIYHSRHSVLQVWLTGAGQLLFSAGMFIAGSYGMARKVYGTEQTIRTLGQTVGMSVMAVGGVLALAGGVYFVVNFVKIVSSSRSKIAALQSPSWERLRS